MSLIRVHRTGNFAHTISSSNVQRQSTHMWSVRTTSDCCLACNTRAPLAIVHRECLGRAGQVSRESALRDLKRTCCGVVSTSWTHRSSQRPLDRCEPWKHLSPFTNDDSQGKEAQVDASWQLLKAFTRKDFKNEAQECINTPHKRDQIRAAVLVGGWTQTHQPVPEPCIVFQPSPLGLPFGASCILVCATENSMNGLVITLAITRPSSPICELSLHTKVTLVSFACAILVYLLL